MTEITPDQSARMVQHFEDMNTTPRRPMLARRWILPAIAGALIGLFVADTAATLWTRANAELMEMGQ